MVVAARAVWRLRAQDQNRRGDRGVLARETAVVRPPLEQKLRRGLKLVVRGTHRCGHLRAFGPD
jgi:hypothetical protein